MTFGMLKHLPEEAKGGEEKEKIEKPEWLEREGKKSDRAVEYHKKGGEKEREKETRTAPLTREEIKAKDQARTPKDALDGFRKIANDYKQSQENNT